MNNSYLTIDFSYLVEGLKGDTMIPVSNMGRKRVAYIIEEIGVTRDFRQFQEGQRPDTKNIPFGELYALSNMPGGMQLIWDNLKIDSNDARQALGLPLAEDTPEVEYDRETVANIVQKGTEDEILDMLEFGPYYIAEWIKEEAINVDSSKRRHFIGQVLQINIDALEENVKWAAGDEDAGRLQYQTIKGIKTNTAARSAGRRSTGERTEGKTKTGTASSGRKRRT